MPKVVMPKIRTTPLALLILTLLAMARPAPAHVENGAMPDPVAEMEYRILLEFKPDDATTRSRLGMALLRQNKLSEAEREFRFILRNDPEHFDARDGLGLVLLGQGRTTEAITELQAAARIRPDDVMVYLHLGQALATVSRAADAWQALQSGLSLLERQPPSPAREQQRRDFLAVLQEVTDRGANNVDAKE